MPLVGVIAEVGKRIPTIVQRGVLIMRKRDVKTSLVAFVDMLGFSNKTLSIKSYADTRVVDKQLKTVQQKFMSDPSDKWDALDVKRERGDRQ